MAKKAKKTSRKSAAGRKAKKTTTECKKEQKSRAEEETVKPKLNPLQLKFCKLYASDREFFGNGVRSYAKAYNIDLRNKSGYSTARTNASRLLTNANILTEINRLLDLIINEQFVDKQLAFLITQHADLHVKLGAIKEYNNLKQRITQKGVIELQNIPIFRDIDEELAFLEERKQFLLMQKNIEPAIAEWTRKGA